ncbi:mucolipin, partial [Reticulomyxa filosa]
MTPWERLKLGPFQKWKRYGLPPWKLFLNVLAVIATTVSIYLIEESLAPYARVQQMNWENILVPSSLTYSGYASDYTYDIFTISDFMSSLESYVQTYYELPNATVGNYEYMEAEEDNNNNNNNTNIRPIKMELIRYKYPSDLFNTIDSSVNTETYTSVYELQDKWDLGPFNNESGREEVIHSMDAMHLSFDVQNIDVENGDRVCYVNHVKESYKYYYRGHVQLTVHPSVYMCGSEYHKNFVEMHFMPLMLALFVVIVFSISLEYLHIKAVIKHIEIYQLIKRQAKTRRQEWRNLSWRDKLEFFNVWFFVTSMGNIASIIGSIWCVRLLLFETTSIDLNPPFFFIGIGCIVLAFVVGVLPIFIGFACFGVAYFASFSSLFSSIDQAAVTLFSLLNGDSIHD